MISGWKEGGEERGVKAALQSFCEPPHHTTSLPRLSLLSLTMSDDEQHNQTFEPAGAGASLTFPMQCSALRKGGHVVIKGRPCKIVDMSTSKTGKHGHAKVHLVAIDIFTNKKLEDISPSTHNMDLENLQVNVDDGFLNLMTPDGTPKDDVRVPDGDLGKQIQADFDDGKELIITVCAAMGEEHALGCKEAPKGAYWAETTGAGTDVCSSFSHCIYYIDSVYKNWPSIQ
ncbi:Eukaryotic translation initiation factor 5A, partial [Rhizoctonia solani AG-8 WAC10335]